MSVHPVKHLDLASCQALAMGIGMLAGVCTLSHYSSSVNSNPAKGNILDQIRTRILFPNRHTHTNRNDRMNTVHARTHYRHHIFLMHSMMTQPHLC